MTYCVSSVVPETTMMSFMQAIDTPTDKLLFRRSQNFPFTYICLVFLCLIQCLHLPPLPCFRFSEQTSWREKRILQRLST